MKKYRQTPKFPPCRLNRIDLRELLSIINEGFDDKKRLSINTSLKNLEIREDNLNDFLKHKDLPMVLHNLTLSLSSGWDSKEDRSVYISFSDLSTYSLIDGVDEAWVIGKCEQLKNFLNSKRAKFSFLHSSKLYWLALIMVNLITQLALHFVPASLNIYSVSSTIVIATFALFGWILVAYLMLVMINPRRFHPYTEIKLKNNTSPSLKWDINTKLNLGTLIISILAIGVTIAIFILSLIIKSKSIN